MDRKMMLKKILSIFLLIFFAFCIRGEIWANEHGIVKLSQKIVESSANEYQLTTLINLKARNMGDTPIRNVSVSVLCVENMFIDVSTVFFGDINSRETAISPEKITMSMNIDSPQDLHPKSKLIWKIEYINDNNEHIVEEFSF
mgnify:CR=1 FL=1|jgi:hypothetical protein